MSFQPPDPETLRRQQGRRALGWGTGLVVIALIVLGIVLGSVHGSVEVSSEFGRGRVANVPYGETMTSAQYDAIVEGESEAAVLEGLNATGRPESRTEPYVLVLFPPPAASDVCTYWEFSDKPEIFARLCFERSEGELTSKLDGDVAGAPRGQGSVV
jgi:hypothetical protein